MSVSKLLEVVAADGVFFEESGGGVTFSGGEPLMQPEFLEEALLACRQQGLHTAVDTCGLAAKEQLLRVAPLADLFLFDLKLMDEAKHQELTGASNRAILENLQALGQVHQQIWVRVPIIPGINDAAGELEATARFAASVPGVRQVNLLPFHRTGLHKAHRLGEESPLRAMQPPAPEAMAAALAIFQSRGLSARIGG